MKWADEFSTLDSQASHNYVKYTGTSDESF